MILIRFILIITFITSCLYVPIAQAGEMVLPVMPIPGTRVNLSPAFIPAHLQGITIHPDNALQFDFLIHKGDGQLDNQQKKEEYNKLVKYFLASLTIPDQDQWVNLSPYENNRIIKDDFGKTEMGRDLLSQDYFLKQITSSLMYPESGLGKKFWDKVYERAHKEFGTTNVPVNTFNKVWIVPDEAVVYESGNTAYILKSHLKIMLEEDYLSLEKHSAIMKDSVPRRWRSQTHTVTSKIIREIILPEIEREINEGKNFAMLRQVYSGMVLATWYKKALKESLLGKAYADKAKVKGVDQDPKVNDEIYQKYLAAFKKGVYSYIKEDFDQYANQVIPRKYFAGGFNRAMNTEVHVFKDAAQLPADVRDQAMAESSVRDDAVRVDFSPINYGTYRTLNGVVYHSNGPTPKGSRYATDGKIKIGIQVIEPIAGASQLNDLALELAGLKFQLLHDITGSRLLNISGEINFKDKQIRLSTEEFETGVVSSFLRHELDHLIQKLYPGNFNGYISSSNKTVFRRHVDWMHDYNVGFFFDEVYTHARDLVQEIDELLSSTKIHSVKQDILTGFHLKCMAINEFISALDFYTQEVFSLINTHKDVIDVHFFVDDLLKQKGVVATLSVSFDGMLIQVNKVTDYSASSINKESVIREYLSNLIRINSEIQRLVNNILVLLDSLTWDPHSVELLKTNVIALNRYLREVGGSGQDIFQHYIKSGTILNPTKINPAQLDVSAVIKSNGNTKGGIDMNSANIIMQIKRDGKGVPLPLLQQDWAQLNQIQGFVPKIIEISPVTTLPILSELQQKLRAQMAHSASI